MLTRIHLLTAVCLSATAGLFVGNLNAADAVTVTGSQTVTIHGNEPEALPTGISSKELNKDKAVEKSFKKLAEDALSKNGMDNIIGLLVDQDRQRIKDSAGMASLNNLDGNNNQRLNDVATGLNAAFKTKYGKAIDIDYAKTFTPDYVTIMTGVVNDPTLLIGRWPVQGSAAGKVTAADAQEAQNKHFGGEVNLEKGREVGVGFIRSSQGFPGMTASLIHENLGGWKFDVPNSLTAQKLHDNLLANLGAIRQDSLPADVNDANREVINAVTAALYDVDLSHFNGTALDNGGVRPAPSAENR